MIHLLKAAQDTLKTVEHIADKALDEMKMHLEQCRKDLNAHTDKCKQELDEHTAKCTNAIDEHVSKTVESTYEQSCKGISYFNLTLSVLALILGTSPAGLPTWKFH
ncbi:hypothetical protein DPMN_152353 [Dreissena polymorpha]|uniref:Uncharacterized protein n=1 Tax=Dreissena polymorpha TaxID=45954 RepID=A0A9D4FLN4_DREPO|nr:hypothetical protein DPMN_152353 [Dreissena polymorpha]